MCEQQHILDIQNSIAEAVKRGQPGAASALNDLKELAEYVVSLESENKRLAAEVKRLKDEG